MDIGKIHVCPSIPQGAIRGWGGGGGGGHKFKSLGKLSNDWTDWHQILYTSADSSGNGPRLNTIRPSIPQGAFGGVKGSQVPKVWEAVKRLDLLAPTLVHVCGFTWEWTSAKYKSPLNTQGHWGGGGVGGSHIQNSEEAVKRLDRLAQHLVQVCGFI